MNWLVHKSIVNSQDTMKLFLLVVTCFCVGQTSGYFHYLVGMEETLLYSHDGYVTVCPNGGEPMKEKMKDYDLCMGTVAENIDTLGQGLGPEEFRKIAKNLRRTLSPEAINRISNKAARQFCNSSKPKMDCFFSLISTLRTCNHTRSADAVRFFTAINQVQRYMCSAGAVKYADFYREQLSQDCFDSSRNACVDRLGPMWVNYLQNKNGSSLFTSDNCKLLKESGDCIVAGLSSCLQNKTVAVFQSVHRILLTHTCGSEYYG